MYATFTHYKFIIIIIIIIIIQFYNLATPRNGGRVHIDRRDARTQNESEKQPRLETVKCYSNSNHTGKRDAFSIFECDWMNWSFCAVAAKIVCENCENVHRKLLERYDQMMEGRRRWELKAKNVAWNFLDCIHWTIASSSSNGEWIQTHVRAELNLFFRFR